MFSFFKVNRSSRLDPNSKTMIAPDSYTPEIDVTNFFWHRADELRPEDALEVGTRRSYQERKTESSGSFPWVSTEKYVRMDVQPGTDVDVIADIHAMPDEWSNRFGIVIADAVFEHLERPWIAAKEIARVLKPGGLFLVTTHQCFPIHGHPNDFFRFSKQALQLIFEDAGLIVDVADYSERCLIVPPEHIIPYELLEAWNRDHPSYAMVRATGHKAS